MPINVFFADNVLPLTLRKHSMPIPSTSSIVFVLGLSLCVIPLKPAIAQSPELIPQATAQDRLLIESGQQLAHQISAVEWLGPLAPIALSPFFGLACLSGIACYGPDWLQQRSALFAESSPLNNPILFWTMVVLTIATSLPRYSKVSKPFALVAEKLEAYSVILIVIAMRFLADSSPSNVETTIFSPPEFHAAGFESIPFDVALAIASAINIAVINGVKLFAEFLIWLTPIPFVDAAVEVASKSLCLGLTALYCWSPGVATLLNLGLLVLCAAVYGWTQRRIAYYLDMLLGAQLEKWLPWLFGANAKGEVVFLYDRWNGIPALTKMRLQGSATKGWQLTRAGWFRTSVFNLPPCQPKISSAILFQSLLLTDQESTSVFLHQRRQPSSEPSKAPALAR